MPSYTGEPAPASVKLTFWRKGTLTVSGNGAAKITQGTTDLFAIDSTNTILSGITWELPNKVVTLPLFSIIGVYQATGNLVSDTLQSTYNSSNATVTECVESYSVGSMEAI